MPKIDWLIICSEKFVSLLKDMFDYNVFFYLGTSYRPISLLPTISKVLERLLAHKITTDKKYVNSIPDHQFGFRLNTPLFSKCTA